MITDEFLLSRVKGSNILSRYQERGLPLDSGYIDIPVGVARSIDCPLFG